MPSWKVACHRSMCSGRSPELRPRSVRRWICEHLGGRRQSLSHRHDEHTVEPLPGVKVVSLRAAHETLATDANGCHRFLGYALIVSTPRRSVVVLHSGDTIPFAGQAEEMRRLAPDLLLLPVNGRSRGVVAI